MRKTPTLITFVTIVTLGGATSPARADELVQVAPHRADVQPASSKDTPPLLAYLARPVGAGPFPAAVVLHSCGGFSRHDTEAAARLKSWGFVALALDSFGDAGVCTQAESTAAEMLDAYAALCYLRAQSFVAADRIAVVGFSMGALAALWVHSQHYLRSKRAGPGSLNNQASGLLSPITPNANTAPAS